MPVLASKAERSPGRTQRSLASLAFAVAQPLALRPWYSLIEHWSILKFARMDIPRN